MHCPGKYCNVYLEDDVSAVPNSKKILNKSLILDKFENSSISEADPLGLQCRNFLSLDYLMLKLPNLRPSNFYNLKKVCKNCQLAYSIIDNQRYKHRKSVLHTNNVNSTDIDQSFSNLQTKSSIITQKFMQNVEKFKERMQSKKIKRYVSMRSIFLPVGSSNLSNNAKQILSHLVNDTELEKDEKNMIIKEAKTANFKQPHEVCELAKSITDKFALGRNNRTMKPSKSLPHIGKHF